MNKSIGIALVVIAGLILSALIFGAGLLVGSSNYGSTNFGPFTMMGRNFTYQGYSNMRNSQNMMGGNGMMGGYTNGSAANTPPLTIDQAKEAVDSYLKGLNNSDLDLKEIMIFDNNAYARITEKSTGIGALELLVDPFSLSVFPEYGPNMMWNLKYGQMSGNGMMGGTGGMMGSRGMMGGYNTDPGAVSATMTVIPEQALQAAQQYLDQQYPGYKTAEDADPFYGYYTIDIMKDGQPTGMLSVNGFSGQVFLHSWHGTFIEMFE
ncbi:MAG: hypothetical protein CVU46_02195 [Chloroflexi bacterium HGW-Chloroflexi-8]|jgi:hypothetical protein|nr:MAG: hypothetical protein CVU46_02195 [Chloroflexi bacterium HGW-Chloroflexi-8]